MTTSALWDVPESCGCVLSRTEGHRCAVPFGDAGSDEEGPVTARGRAVEALEGKSGRITLRKINISANWLGVTDRPAHPEGTA